jgi:uncharacterized protein YndB with AHSA1/START domain
MPDQGRKEEMEMNKRRFVMGMMLAVVAASAQEATKKKSPVRVTRLSEPEKALQFEVEVAAKPAEVWEAFTTSAGLDTWLWQDCTVDLRAGGEWMVHFPGGKTGGGTIIGFRPQQQLVLHALAPDQFPEVRRVGTTATFDFAPAGEHTRVTLTQTGWKSGKEWDDAYDYLASGNAQLLEQLYVRFARGPIQWN